MTSASFSTIPRLQRFWDKVDKTEKCWFWAGARTATGYGSIWQGGQMIHAHRFSYENLIGPIPEGHDVHHLCGVRYCVNPEHLTTVGHAAHASLHSANARRTHCPKGHPYSEENVYLYRGSRYCKACDRSRKAARYRQAQATQSLRETGSSA